jgi:hypothetical protein
MNIYQKLKQSRPYHQFMCYNNKSTFKTLRTGDSTYIFYFLNARRIRNDSHFCCTVPVLRPFELVSVTLRIRWVCDTGRRILTMQYATLAERYRHCSMWHWQKHIDTAVCDTGRRILTLQYVTLAEGYWHCSMWHWQKDIDTEVCDTGRRILTLQYVTLVEGYWHCSMRHWQKDIDTAVCDTGRRILTLQYVTLAEGYWQGKIE